MSEEDSHVSAGIRREFRSDVGGRDFHACRVQDAEGLEAARVEFLGAKNGRIKAAQKEMGAVPGPDKPAAGKKFNETRAALELAVQGVADRVGSAPKAASGPLLDPTLPVCDRGWATFTPSRRRWST